MSERAPNLLQRIMRNRLIWPFLGLALLLLYNVFFTEKVERAVDEEGTRTELVNPFFHLEVRDGHLYGTPMDILKQGSKVMLLGIGMTLVIAVCGVDLSVGSVMAIAGAVAAMLVTQTDMMFALAVFLALALSFAAGLWNGVLVAFAGVQPIVATLILMVAGRGLAMLITGGNIITFEHEAFTYVANGHFLGLPFPVVIVCVVFLATAVFLRKTAVGLFIESVGDNETASRLCGINARYVKVVVYGFCGLCAGMAGVIAASDIKAADPSRVGEMRELDAIFAVVVGGTALTGGRFTLVGSIIGALLIQTLTTTMYIHGVPPAIAPVPKAVVIVAVCLLQSESFRMQMRRLLGINSGRIRRLFGGKVGAG